MLQWAISYGLWWDNDSRKRIAPPRAHFGSENLSLRGSLSVLQGVMQMQSCAYVCAEDEEVSSDPERADLLILSVLVREESVLPFLRLLHVCLNLEYSAIMESAQYCQFQQDNVSESAHCCQ